MSPTELFRTASFRLALAFALAMMGAMLVQFTLVYSQMTALDIRRSSELLNGEAKLLRAMQPDHLDYVIQERATDDLRVVINAAGIFNTNHIAMVGDLRTWPPGLVPDGVLHRIEVMPEEGAPYTLRFLAQKLDDGRILVLGRSLHLLSEQKLMMRRAWLITTAPIIALALMAGLWLSHRALARVKTMSESIDLIMAGDIKERLPAGRERDDLQRLAGSVNRMLDRLEQLMHDMREVGNDIAHDLRTPLSRVRTGLERAIAGNTSTEALKIAIARAMEDLDQSFTIITALLRMAEIDNSRRRDAFAEIELGALARDITDLYEPIAESEGITLDVASSLLPVRVQGDRDLMIEALANLVDNAIKFTPEGGNIRVRATIEQGIPVLEVSDTGPGIAPEEREAVLTRFYRSDKSRHIPGSGLGLSLVVSILRLHNARITIEDAVAGKPENGTLFRVIFPFRAAL